MSQSSDSSYKNRLIWNVQPDFHQNKQVWHKFLSQTDVASQKFLLFRQQTKSFTRMKALWYFLPQPVHTHTRYKNTLVTIIKSCRPEVMTERGIHCATRVKKGKISRKNKERSTERGRKNFQQDFHWQKRSIYERKLIMLTEGCLNFWPLLVNGRMRNLGRKQIRKFSFQERKDNQITPEVSNFRFFFQCRLMSEQLCLTYKEEIQIFIFGDLKTTAPKSFQLLLFLTQLLSPHCTVEPRYSQFWPADGRICYNKIRLCNIRWKGKKNLLRIFDIHPPTNLLERLNGSPAGENICA